MIKTGLRKSQTTWGGFFLSLPLTHSSFSVIVRAYARVQHKEGGMGMEAVVGERALMALQ